MCRQPHSPVCLMFNDYETLLAPWNKLLSFYLNLKKLDAPIQDLAAFPAHTLFEDKYEDIKSEASALLAIRESIPAFEYIDPEQAFLTNDGRWQTYFLRAYGQNIDTNMERCPITSRLIRDNPNITTAMFSIMDGLKHVPPHQGQNKGVLRYHLGLIIPKEDGPFMMLSNTELKWQEGKSLLFDDTFTHCVCNPAREPRVILFLDVLRPLPSLLYACNMLLAKMAKTSRRVKEGAERAFI